MSHQLYQHEEMEGEEGESCERSVTDSLGMIMKKRNVSMEVKKGLRNSVLLTTLTHDSETRMWRRSQQSRGKCGVTNEMVRAMKNMYERCGVGPCAYGVNCGMLKWVKKKRD